MFHLCWSRLDLAKDVRKASLQEKKKKIFVINADLEAFPAEFFKTSTSLVFCIINFWRGCMHCKKFPGEKLGEHLLQGQTVAIVLECMCGLLARLLNAPVVAVRVKIFRKLMHENVKSFLSIPADTPFERGQWHRIIWPNVCTPFVRSSWTRWALPSDRSADSILCMIWKPVLFILAKAFRPPHAVRLRYPDKFLGINLLWRKKWTDFPSLCFLGLTQAGPICRCLWFLRIFILNLTNSVGMVLGNCFIVETFATIWVRMPTP